VNQVTKLAITSRHQFLALFEPPVRLTGAEVPGNRPGEVFAGLQGVVIPGEAGIGTQMLGSGFPGLVVVIPESAGD